MVRDGYGDGFDFIEGGTGVPTGQPDLRAVEPGLRVEFRAFPLCGFRGPSPLWGKSSRTRTRPIRADGSNAAKLPAPPIAVKRRQIL